MYEDRKTLLEDNPEDRDFLRRVYGGVKFYIWRSGYEKKGDLFG